MSSHEGPQTLVNYCYRCGKKVGRQADRCWYCATPTYRVIRPARRCPFCEEKIGPRAVKCPHCGEYLDGRPAGAGGQEGQVHFHIDKAVISGGQMALPGQAQVESADYDPGRTLEGPGQTPLLGHRPGGARQLPAPGDEAVDAEFEEDGGAGGPPAPSVDPGDPYGHAGSSLARRPDDLGSSKGSSLARRSLNALTPFRKRSDLAPRQPAQEQRPAPPGPPGAGVGVMTEEDRYDRCPLCDTEVLASDSYCFHCGTSLEPAAMREAKIRFLKPKSNLPLHATALILFALFPATRLYLRDLSPLFDDWLIQFAPLLAGFALVAISFFRIRKFTSQALTIAVGIAGLGLMAFGF